MALLNFCESPSLQPKSSVMPKAEEEASTGTAKNPAPKIPMAKRSLAYSPATGSKAWATCTAVTSPSILPKSRVPVATIIIKATKLDKINPGACNQFCHLANLTGVLSSITSLGSQKNKYGAMVVPIRATEANKNSLFKEIAGLTIDTKISPQSGLAKIAEKIKAR